MNGLCQQCYPENCMKNNLATETDAIINNSILMVSQNFGMIPNNSKNYSKKFNNKYKYLSKFALCSGYSNALSYYRKMFAKSVYKIKHVYDHLVSKK